MIIIKLRKLVEEKTLVVEVLKLAGKARVLKARKRALFKIGCYCKIATSKRHVYKLCYFCLIEIHVFESKLAV